MSSTNITLLLGQYTQVVSDADSAATVTVFKPCNYIFATTQPAASVIGHQLKEYDRLPISAFGAGVKLWIKPDSESTLAAVTKIADATVANGTASGGGGGGGAGDASAANQVTGNTSLASIDTKTPALASGRVPVDGSGVTQPVSAAALPLPTGASTSANQTTGNTSLATIATNTTSAATSTKQSDGSQKTQIVDGSGNVIAATSNALNVNLSSGGFATASNQATANTSLSTIATNTTSIATAANQATGNTSLATIATNTGNGATSANQTNGTQLTKITNGTQSADTVVGDTGLNGLVTGSTLLNVAFTTTTNQAVASTNVGAMRYVSVKFTSLGTSATNTFQYSDDNTTWTNLSLWSVTASTNAASGSVLQSAGGNFVGVIPGKYFRINVTGISASSTTGMVTLSNTPLHTMTAVQISSFGGQTLAVSQSGTWTAQPGNTQNTTPWRISEQPFSVTTNFTRPADTTQYAVGDAMSNSTSAPTQLSFTVGSANQSGTIEQVTVLSSVKGSPLAQLMAWIVGSTLASATFLDNAAIEIDTTTFVKDISAIPLVETANTAAKARMSASNLKIPFTADSSGNLYMLLSLLNTYTPASGEVLTVVVKGTLR